MRQPTRASAMRGCIEGFAAGLFSAGSHTLSEFSPECAELRRARSPPRKYSSVGCLREHTESYVSADAFVKLVTTPPAKAGGFSEHA